MSEAPRPWLECVDLHPDVLSEELSEDVFALDLGAFSQASAAGTRPLDSRFRGNDGLKNSDSCFRGNDGPKSSDSCFGGNDDLKSTVHLGFVRNRDRVRRHSSVIPAKAGIQKSRSIIRHFARPSMDKGPLPERERITTCRRTLKGYSRRIEMRSTKRAW